MSVDIPRVVPSTDARIRQHYRAGMPQLAHIGLAENWLLKECGDHHWRALAAATRRELPDFIDDDGHRAYAAFTAIRVHDARLERISEHDPFTIETSLVRSGAARHFSEHRLVAHDMCVARVTMSSAFVLRVEAGNNQTVARARFASLDLPSAGVPAEAATMAKLGKQFRSGEWGDAGGRACIPRESAHAPGIDFSPCPNSDFNGAQFLYFASFQAFTDRAEWMRRTHAVQPVLHSRELYFHGNLNVGDTLTVRVAGQHVGDDELMHWCELRRGSDDVKIADAVTVKRWSRR